MPQGFSVGPLAQFKALAKLLNMKSAELKKRLDGNQNFAWLRRPTDADGVTVEVQAVRRLAFPRAPGVEGYDELPFLSDHLGLHVGLALA